MNIANTAVRVAQHSDIDEIVTVLVASIRTLCVADHLNEESRIGSWLSNKNSENVRKWLSIPDVGVFVALSDGKISGVCAAHWRGHIVLNYVSPNFRFRGVSTAMLKYMEAALLSKEVTLASLVSTLTAKDFYASRGWLPSGDPSNSSGMTGYPMSKDLFSAGASKSSTIATREDQ